MILGIDATNIWKGGGRTHLSDLLAGFEPGAGGFRRIVVWTPSRTSRQLPVRDWIEYRTNPLIEGSSIGRLWWQFRHADSAMWKLEVSVLFVPGGIFLGRFRPLVAMSQNLLPFEPRERRRYALRITGLRYAVVRFLQSMTFRRATGVVFLTEYARDRVSEATGVRFRRSVVIPHGVGTSFFRTQERLLSTSKGHTPFRLLYVSVVDLYKHQWNVVEAVGRLRRSGHDVCLDLVGPALYGQRRLARSIRNVDPNGEFVRYHGLVSRDDLPSWYGRADAFVFASTCENMPIILLEAMAASLPIASSNRGPMPEVVGDAAVLFDPEEVSSIANAVGRLVTDRRLRRQLAERADRRARQFTAARCASETMSFLQALSTNTGVDTARPIQRAGAA